MAIAFETRTTRRGALLAGAGLLLYLGSSSLRRPAAAAGAAGARAFIDGLAAEALAVIRSPELATAERQRRFRELFRRAFDVPAIGRFVLGRHWSRTAPEERQRYLDLFGDYVAGLYAAQFANYRGEGFRTTGVRTTGEGESAVAAQIDRPNQAPIRIDFRVREESGSFKIVDVAVENVSLIVTKRDEFSSTLYSEGVPGVMKRMQAALDGLPRAGG